MFLCCWTKLKMVVGPKQLIVNSDLLIQFKKIPSLSDCLSDDGETSSNLLVTAVHKWKNSVSFR